VYSQVLFVHDASDHSVKHLFVMVAYGLFAGCCGIKLCLIDNAVSDWSRIAWVALKRHCQHTIMKNTQTFTLCKFSYTRYKNSSKLGSHSFAQIFSHNGLQPAPATIEHLNGAGFAFGDELPLLLKDPIRNGAGLFLKLLLQGYSMLRLSTLAIPRYLKTASIIGAY
jgi:hypothetical protein